MIETDSPTSRSAVEGGSAEPRAGRADVRGATLPRPGDAAGVGSVGVPALDASLFARSAAAGEVHTVGLWCGGKDGGVDPGEVRDASGRTGTKGRECRAADRIGSMDSSSSSGSRERRGLNRDCDRDGDRDGEVADRRPGEGERPGDPGLVSTASLEVAVDRLGEACLPTEAAEVAVGVPLARTTRGGLDGAVSSSARFSRFEDRRTDSSAASTSRAEGLGSPGA